MTSVKWPLGWGHSCVLLRLVAGMCFACTFDTLAYIVPVTSLECALILVRVLSTHVVDGGSHWLGSNPRAVKASPVHLTFVIV